MLFRPISAYPSNNNTIDVTSPNFFTTIIQGSSSIVTAYKATIYNSDDYAQKYTTNRVELDYYLTAGQELEIEIPVVAELTNNNSYYWELILYQTSPDIFVINTVVQSGSTATSIKIRNNINIVSGMYLKIGTEQKKISSYTIDETQEFGTAVVESAFSTIPTQDTRVIVNSDFVKSLQFSFLSKATPTLEITNIPTTLSQRDYNFIMQLNGEDYTPVKWYQFEILNSEEEIIFDTGKVYSSLLEAYFQGFAGNETYKIRGRVENTDGLYLSTETYSFVTSYSSPYADITPYVSVNKQETSVKIEWVADEFTDGKVTGEYSFVEDEPYVGTNSLLIENGIIYYDSISDRELEIDENNFGLFIDITIDNSQRGKIIELSNETDSYYIENDNKDLITVKNGTVISRFPIYKYVKDFLQPTNIPENNTNYIWNDDMVWDDEKYWVEGEPFTNRYKISILSDKVLIKQV